LRNAGAFEELDKLPSAKVFVAPLDDSPVSLQPFPLLGEARRCTRICIARMRDALDSHDQAEYLRAFETVLTLGRAVANVPTVIGRTVGSSVQGVALHMVILDLMNGRLAPDSGAEVSLAIARQPLPDLKVAFNLEREAALDTIDAFYDFVGAQGRGASPA